MEQGVKPCLFDQSFGPFPGFFLMGGVCSTRARFVGGKLYFKTFSTTPDRLLSSPVWHLRSKTTTTKTIYVGALLNEFLSLHALQQSPTTGRYRYDTSRTEHFGSTATRWPFVW